MKKTYLYFLIPLVAMIAFSAYYWNFTASYDEREAAKAAEVQRVQQSQRDEEAVQRQKAVDDAFAAQQRRKLEREAKAAHEQKEEDDRTSANEAALKAHREVTRLREKTETLEREVQQTQDDLTKFNLEKEVLVTQQSGLADAVKLAEANTKKLSDVLDKISAADAAAEAAAKAAAAAAKKE
jgi:hypothetical protein